MFQHDVLAARAMNRYVLLCTLTFPRPISPKESETQELLFNSGGHTNTERGYLPTLREKLLAEQATDSDLSGLDIQISRSDRHPLDGL